MLKYTTEYYTYTSYIYCVNVKNVKIDDRHHKFNAKL